VIKERISLCRGSWPINAWHISQKNHTTLLNCITEIIVWDNLLRVVTGVAYSLSFVIVGMEYHYFVSFSFLKVNGEALCLSKGTIIYHHVFLFLFLFLFSLLSVLAADHAFLFKDGYFLQILFAMFLTSFSFLSHKESFITSEKNPFKWWNWLINSFGLYFFP